MFVSFIWSGVFFCDRFNFHRLGELAGCSEEVLEIFHVVVHFVFCLECTKLLIYNIFFREFVWFLQPDPQLEHFC